MMYNIINYILATVFDWTEFSTDFNNFWMQGFKVYLGDAFWPVVFIGVFGLIFVLSKGNIIATTAAILFTFGVFGTNETFVGNPEFSLMFSIIAIAGFAGAVVLLFTKKGS